MLYQETPKASHKPLETPTFGSEIKRVLLKSIELRGMIMSNGHLLKVKKNITLQYAAINHDKVFCKYAMFCVIILSMALTKLNWMEVKQLKL